MGIWMMRILVGQTFSYLEQGFLSLSPVISIFDEMVVVLTQSLLFGDPQSRDHPIALRRIVIISLALRVLTSKT